MAAAPALRPEGGPAHKAETTAALAREVGAPLSGLPFFLVDAVYKTTWYSRTLQSMTLYRRRRGEVLLIVHGPLPPPEPRPEDELGFAVLGFCVPVLPFVGFSVLGFCVLFLQAPTVPLLSTS